MSTSQVINSHLSSYWWQVMIMVMIILAILWLLWSKLSNSGAPPSLPPGPYSLPIIGYLPFLGRNLHTQFTNMAHTYGPIFKVPVGSKLLVVINTPELAKMVVRDQDDIFSNRPLTIAASIATYGGQDIAFSNSNSSWRNLRKLLVHEVLSNKNLEASSCFRRDEVRKTIKSIYSKMGTPIDLNEISFSTEANVLTRMVWDSSSDDEDHSHNRRAELRRIVSKLTEIFGRPNVSDFIPSLAWFDLQGIEREVRKEFKKLEGIITSIIDNRIEYNSKNRSGVGHEAGKKDFLQTLLEQLKNQKDAASLDITKIKTLVINIMVAGTETTASLTEWAMVEIMQNHKVMERVQEELAQIVGPNNIVEESHLAKLKYLDATIKETLRLHPVLPLLLSRSPSQSCTVGGYTIPKGCTIFLNAWAIHRDPRYWDNPLEFNPERFLGVDKYDFKGNNLKFFPFGSGRRLCPGITLADKMQMYILASLLYSFDWSLPKGEEHDFSDMFCVTLMKRKPLIAIPSQRLPDMSLYM